VFVISGCNFTYTDKNVGQSIIDICKKEYKIDVKVKRVGRTLGIYVPIDGLFEVNPEVKGKITLEDALSGIRFSKEAADNIDKVSLVLSRVALSTDAPIDFYILMAADTKGLGLRIIVTRYAADMKRLILGDVSRGDYVQRLLMDMDFDPVVGAEQTAKNFFYDLQRLPANVMITRYFSKSNNAKDNSRNFFLYLSELGYKQDRRLYIKDVKGLQIEKNKVLVKCKVKEIYSPLAGHEYYDFLYPSGFENEYLILMDTSYLPYMIEQVFPVYMKKESGGIEKLPYPDIFSDYSDDTAWDKYNFFLEEMHFPDFLAWQIVGRIRALYQSDLDLKSKFVVNFVKGDYLPKDKKFKIALDIEKSKTNKSVDFSLDSVWNIISQVMRRYNFQDYQSVELVNLVDSKVETMGRDELLDKFWPKWLLKSKKAQGKNIGE